MNEKFAHLHLHTDASLRDGMGTVANMIGRVKELGFQQVAMTDHGTLANAVTFSIEAQRAGVKPLLGMEGYIAFDGQIGHITLLADGLVGWNSLLALDNIAHQSEFRQPAFTVDDLVDHQSGLLCLTGCIASPLQQLTLEEASRLGTKLKEVFGPRLFAELMFVGDSLGWERPMRLAERLRLKKVITNDVHFARRQDGEVHSVLTRMKSGFEYDSSQLYLKDYEQLVKAGIRYGIPADEIRAMLDRTGAIARKLKPVALKAEPVLPSVGMTKDEFIAMVKDTYRGREYLGRPEYLARFKYELEIISEMGFIDYFVILDDIIRAARDHHVKVGPGRGSGAGSLILFLLRVTDVDPIKYDLQFERFLNPERRGMPDVDVDIESDRRQLVLDYAEERYGAKPIATYSTYSHRSLIRDLGKFFKLDKKLVDEVAEAGENSKAFAILRRDHPKVAQCYDAFIGQIRHKGKHAGGVIITDTPVPVERISGGETAAAWTEGKSNDLSYAGIVKFDLLGLSALSALRELEEVTGDMPPEPVEFAPAFRVFREGNLAGVFQFAGSDGIRKLTMELQPTKFEDLIAINALYRPGAIDAGAMELYPKWKKEPRKMPAYIADVLEETYGAIVYQEQVMEIFRRTIGGSLGEADLARRVIVKSKPSDPEWVKKFGGIRDQFIAGAEAKGLSPKEAKSLWSELATHSRYSFNKAHSTAYAMISWQCAWWKFNYPAHFYAALLNSDPQQEQTYILEAVRGGIAVGPPHVNKSTDRWTADATRINMPLGAVKFMGDSGSTALINARTEGGVFSSIEDFMARVPKRFVRARARAGLWRLGGFSGVDKPSTFVEIEKALELKDVEEETSVRKNQLKYLGVIVPNKKLLDTFAEYDAKGWISGIIESRDVRRSDYGEYVVYRLSPTGVFWSREVKDLQKGDVVAVDVSSRNGRAKRIKRI